MNCRLVFVAALSFALCLPASAKDKNTRTAGWKYLEDNFETYDKLQKSIHSYAELGYLETRSCEALASHLESEGFTIERGVAGIPTAFIATFGSGKPVIGLLGEFDALPGMSQDTVAFPKPLVEGAPGHGCGHNLLGTGPCAAAVAISKWLADGHTGTVKYFGCPAEEGGGGKAYMTRDGCFDGLDAVFDWHPGSTNCVALGAGLANLNVLFTFHGISAHAAGAPWDGRSALDAVEAFNMMMNLMREHVRPEVRIHYNIPFGGGAPNVVPDKATVNYYIRPPKADEMIKVFERALKAAEGAAMGTGTTVEYEIVNGNYERLKNRRLCQLTLESLKEAGGVKLDARERAFVLEVMKNSGVAPEKIDEYEKIAPEVFPPAPGGGSSDVGNVSQIVPCSSLIVEVTPPGIGIHTWQMASIGGTTVGTKAAIVVAKTQYLTALKLYQNPSEIEAAWKEFREVQGPDFKYVPLVGDRTPPLNYR